MILSKFNPVRTMSGLPAIKERKAWLRKNIEGKIKSLSKEEKDRQSKNVFQKLLQLNKFQESSRISVYLSTVDEIDTTPILKEIFKEKKSCFVPRYQGKTMEMVKLNSMTDWENLPLTKWNIKQPPLKEKRENALHTGGLDLVILPGVAFTKEGHRLGHGMGYYDKFLWELKRDLPNNTPYLVALGFKEQIVDELPLEDTDYKLDVVLYSD